MAATAHVVADRSKPARGLTLREIQRFIDEALIAGFSPDEMPNVRAGFRLGLQHIEISGEVNPP